MGLRFKDGKHGQCFFVTTTFQDHKPHARSDNVCCELADSLNFYREKYDAAIIAYVFMPTHLHLLIAIDGKHLPNFMRDFKKYTAQQGLPKCGIQDREVWTSRYDRVAITSEKAFRIKLNYIHENPIRAGLVPEAEQWRWSSAADYIGQSDSPVEVWTEWHW